MNLKNVQGGAKRTALTHAINVLLSVLIASGFSLWSMTLSAQEPLCIKAGSIWTSEELSEYDNPRNFAYRFMGINDDNTRCDLMAGDCDRVMIWSSFVYDNPLTPWPDRKGKRGIDLNTVRCE